MSNSVNIEYTNAGKRKYELKKRAEQVEATRRRITEATVELHRTVGPAATQISEIARRAGVQRVTVYNHFPDEAALFAACSAHWRALHPAPDPAAWLDDDGPGRAPAPRPRRAVCLVPRDRADDREHPARRRARPRHAALRRGGPGWLSRGGPADPAERDPRSRAPARSRRCCSPRRHRLPRLASARCSRRCRSGGPRRRSRRAGRGAAGGGSDRPAPSG